MIADLPDKTEARAECALSPRQAALYQEAVDGLARQLQQVDGMERRGLVLALLVVVADIGARRTVHRALPDLLRQVQE